MAVPLVRLFSLDLLKAFVAVGRRMSVTQAAEDLCLTQSAVSRQIHALELQVGVKLFVRKQRGVAFTREGERLFRSADHAIGQLQDVAAQIGPGDHPEPVTITASIGVVGLWLLPRLGSLQQRHPRIDVRLSASNQLSDLRADGIDLAIRYARDTHVPADAVRLFGETIAPVAHPSVAEALSNGERRPLLDFEDTRPWLQWRRWFEEGGASHSQVIHFNQYDQVIQAALAGQGVALGRVELIQPLIDSRQLAIVRMPCKPVQSPCAYWLLLADEQPRENVRRVADWVHAEAERVRQWRHPG